MGFDGYVMTDWNGYGDQGMEGLLRAGIGWIAPGSPDDSLVNPIVSAFSVGRLQREFVRRNLARLVRICARSATSDV